MHIHTKRGRTKKKKEKSHREGVLKEKSCAPARGEREEKVYIANCLGRQTAYSQGKKKNSRPAWPHWGRKKKKERATKKNKGKGDTYRGEVCSKKKEKKERTLCCRLSVPQRKGNDGGEWKKRKTDVCKSEEKEKNA